jgi:hypothetical protein
VGGGGKLVSRSVVGNSTLPQVFKRFRENHSRRNKRLAIAAPPSLPPPSLQPPSCLPPASLLPLAAPASLREATNARIMLNVAPPRPRGTIAAAQFPRATPAPLVGPTSLPANNPAPLTCKISIAPLSRRRTSRTFTTRLSRV